MDWQSQKDCLDKLYEDPLANDSEIIRIYEKIIKDSNFIASDEVVQFLNEKAVLLLEPELVEILIRNRIQSRAYLLVANNLSNLEDMKDDLLNGNVLATLIPTNSLRKLKINLGLATSTSSTAAQSVQLLTKQTETMKLTATPTDNVENAHSQNPGEPSEMISSSITAASFQENEPTQSDNISMTKADCQQEIAFSTGDTSNRLASKLRKYCKVKKQDNGIEVWYMGLRGKFSFGRVFQRLSFGDPDPKMTSTWKTILLMGGSGFGKTTMINAMINFVLGVEWDDPFRFKLVDEQVRKTQANSQTREVTAYDLHYQNGFRIPYSLTIVDTPGIGDTHDLARDMEITKDIWELFRDENGIQEMDVVGIVVQSSLSRLTASLNYIFDSILSIFGRDVTDNIHFMVTFSDGNPPLVLEAIKKAELPCRMDSNGTPCHNNFNNGSIYKKGSINNSQQSEGMSQIQWENGMSNFESFFQELSNMPTKSLNMTKQVLETRKYLETQLQFMQRNINSKEMKITELRQTEQMIALHKDQMDANMSFEITVPKIIHVRLPTKENIFHLNCTICQTTCHAHCNPKLWTGLCPVFWRLQDVIKLILDATRISLNLKEAMEDPASSSAVLQLVTDSAKNLIDIESSIGKCNLCPGKCPVSAHQHENAKWDDIQVEETRTVQDINKKYEEAMGKMLNVEGLKNALQNEIETIDIEITKAIEDVVKCDKLLREIALYGKRGNSIFTPEYVQKLIEYAS